ncbi:nucleotidyltransferase family protein [Vallicoccus soli]|uniref:nucleotidyltransferase family protein n=1 Tax=Vallicoccus soli TaxID=2339232 RepID=UPI001C49B071|nr:nucleotidyltransferase family protein [Vallicoccus soli]
MQPQPVSEREAVRDVLKRVAVALKQGGVPFALCGGYAAWVRGAPEPEHDADFLVPAGEAGRAREVLAAAGLDVQVPAEDWLVKVVVEGAFVDVLWRTCGAPVEADLVERAEPLAVLSVEMPVLAATDILVTKLLALDEHYCDFGRLLPVARALREQVDWDRVRRDVAGNDFAVVLLLLLERRGIIEPAAAVAKSNGAVGGARPEMVTD